MRGKRNFRSLTKLSTLCLALVAFLAFIVPSAQAAVATDAEHQPFYTVTESTTNILNENKSDESKPFVFTEEGILERAVKFAQEVQVEKDKLTLKIEKLPAGLPEVTPFVVLKMKYTPANFIDPEEGEELPVPTVGSLTLQFYGEEEEEAPIRKAEETPKMVWNTYDTFAKHTGRHPLSNLQANTWLIFNAGEIGVDEDQASLTSGTELEPGKTYDIYYAAPVTDLAPRPEIQPLAETAELWLDNKSRLIAPAERANEDLDFVSKNYQIDDKFDLGAGGYVDLSEYTWPTQNVETEVNPLEAGWLNNRTPVGGKEETNNKKTLALTTDLTEHDTYKNATFVTYAVQFRTPKDPNDANNTDIIKVQPPLPLTVDNAVEVRRYSDDVNYEKDVISKAFVENPESEISWVAGPVIDGVVDSKIAVTDLNYDATYIAYYTVRVVNGVAISNVAVVTRTASFSNDPTDSAYTDFFPMNSEYGQADVTDSTKLLVTKVPEMEQVDAETPSNRVEYGADVFGNTGPVMGFELGGFGTDASNPDAMIFSRTFTYKVEENGTPENITTETVRLQKWQIDSDGNRFYFGPFEAVEEEPAKPLAKGAVKALDGKFWLVADLDDDGIADYIPVTAESTTPFIHNQKYTIYFVVQDEGDFDTAKGTLGTIGDPNGVYANAASNKSSGGCSVGGTSAYDMAILLLAALSLVALRVRSRKS